MPRLLYLLCLIVLIPVLFGLFIRVVEELQSGGRTQWPPVTWAAFNPIQQFAPGVAGVLLSAAATAVASGDTGSLSLFDLAPAMVAGLVPAVLVGVLMGSLLAVLGQVAFAFPGRPSSPLFRAACAICGGALSGQFCLAFMVWVVRLFALAI